MEFFPLGISIVVPNLHRWLDRGHFRSPTIFRENAVTKQEWEYIMERDGVSEDEATEYLFAEKDRVYKLLKKKYKRKDDSFEPTQKYDIKDYDKVWKLLKEQRRKHTWWGKLLGL
jgi:FMN phosphatase YigB (HAD superfamily)